MSNPNEHYTNQFDGSLRADTAPSPVKVTTRLRIMNDNHAAEIRNYSTSVFHKSPTYVFGGGTLPQHVGPQAVGRHYFTW